MMLVILSPRNNSCFPVQIVTESKFLGVVADKFLGYSSPVGFNVENQGFSVLRLKRMSVATVKLYLSYIAHCI